MAFSSTITRGLALAVLLAAGLLARPAAAAEREAFTFVYLQQADDPAYMELRAYTGLKLRERKRPLPGAETAIREVRILGRALGVSFQLETRALPQDADPVGFVRARLDEGAGRVFLLDLPLPAVSALAAGLAEDDVVLFNIRHPAVSLREEGCGATLFHTLPSLAMRTDAVAQFLAARDWTRVLVLEGADEADAALSAAFQASASKFGLRVADVHPFVLSNDPRERARNNIALLTAEPGHDAVFLADAYGEFGRYVPYSTHLPRPVVGSEGLQASAWHWTWERHGAPQLNQRFDRQAGRLMADEDWAAWAAVRAVVEAVARTRSTEVARLRAELTAADFAFDIYKGFPGSFRPWNRQLRQGLLLHTHNAVIELAPLSGFLHQSNNLDTLGLDRAESRCRS